MWVIGNTVRGSRGRRYRNGGEGGRVRLAVHGVSRGDNVTTVLVAHVTSRRRHVAFGTPPDTEHGLCIQHRVHEPYLELFNV